MTTYKPHNIFNIQMETITPVSIGNGEILSPYTDFVFDGQGKVHVLDKEEIVDRIFQLDEQVTGPETPFMNRYMDGIYNSFNNNRSEFNLKKFIEDKDILDLDTEATALLTIPAYGLNRNKKQEIKCMVKDNDHSFIPGSSIKGAIKACLLYDWFLNEGNGALDALMKKVLETFNKCKREIQDIERISGRRNVSWEDKKRIKELKKMISRKGGRETSKSIQEVIDALLTKEPKWLPREFGHLKPKDSELISPSHTIVQQVNRLHYSKGIVSIPVNLEAIKKGATTQFKLLINPKFNRREFAFFNEADAMTTLFNRINQFHKHNLDMEINLLNQGQWADKARGREAATFNKYFDFLEAMYEKVDKASENEAYICLGFGKSFFYNSIGMLVYDWDQSKAPDLSEEDKPLFRKYCQLFFLGKDGQKNFPLTRTVTNDGFPMGWLKLTA